MALVGVKLETLVSQPDALTALPPSINATFKNSPAISICIIHNGASRRQTRNACFPARCAHRFTTIYKCYI